MTSMASSKERKNGEDNSKWRNDFEGDGRQSAQWHPLVVVSLQLCRSGFHRPGRVAVDDQISLEAGFDPGGIRLQHNLHAVANRRHVLDRDSLRWIAQLELRPLREFRRRQANLNPRGPAQRNPDRKSGREL